jgi:hypothetical protein
MTFTVISRFRRQQMNIKYDLSELEQRPPIHLKVHGDLRVNGWDRSTLEAQTGDDDPTVAMDEMQILIETEEDLTISLPYNSQLVLEVGGDVSIDRLDGALQSARIGGNLRLDAAKAVTINEVGGDMNVRSIGALTCNRVGGDATLEGAQNVVLDRTGGDLFIRQIEGEIQLSNVGGNLKVETARALTTNNVGGDLYVSATDSLICRKVGGNASVERTQSVDLDRVGGDVQVRQAHTVSCRKVGGNAEFVDVADAVAVSAGGDVSILACLGDIAGNARGDARIEISSASPMVRLNASGTIHCMMNGEIGASVRVICGGELHVKGEENNLSTRGRGVHSFQIGGGDGSISLVAGGDVHVNGAAQVSDMRSVTGDFAQVQHEMKELNVELGHLNQELERMGIELGREFGSLGEKIAEKINRKLRRQFERHTRKAGAKAAGKGWSFGFDFPNPPTPPTPPRAPYGEESKSEPVSEQERMLILRMVEDGKITASEAEKLLAALEGEYPES